MLFFNQPECGAEGKIAPLPDRSQIFSHFDKLRIEILRAACRETIKRRTQSESVAGMQCHGAVR